MTETSLNQEEKLEVQTHGFGTFGEGSEPVQKMDNTSTDPKHWTADKLNKHIEVQREIYRLARKLV